MRGVIDMGDYDVHEVLAMLQKYYITESPQMVTRWIRDGKLQGLRSENRKEGYRVSEDALFDYIEEIRPGLPAIMEVYEEHIKRLRHNQLKEVNHIQANEETSEIKKMFELKEKQFEKEIKELREVVGNHENTNIELQQEKQMNEMNIIELMEKNDKLIQEKSALVEENKTLTELYEIIDEEIRQLKNTPNKPTESETTSKKLDDKTVSTIEEKTIHMTLEEFNKISMDVVSKLELKLDKSEIDYHLGTIYEQIFEEEQIKADLVVADGIIKCPYTQREYRQLKRIINSAIKYYFENLNEQQQTQDQLEQTVANE